MPNLPQQRDRLQPSETLFNTLPLPLTDGISWVLRRPSINRTPTGPFQVLGYVRRGFQVSALGHEIHCVVVLGPSYRFLSRSRNLLQHYQCLIALRRSVSLELLAIYV